MSFKEFDLSDYIHALEEFKNRNTDEVIKYWGSVENYDLFIQKIKDDEPNVAKLAIKQFGSVEAYTAAMKENLAHFSEIMEKQVSEIPEEIRQNDLFTKLAANKEKDVSSDEVQQIVQEIITRAQENALSELVESQDNYCHMIIDIYSNDNSKTVFDTKYGAGSAEYIVDAFRCYLQHNNF